ncbi:hypothetical protein DNU06_09510 [Putridiphycobacter roseus]|uniref:Uncharacterized protein n=1 Tax=Putridiphycobacter roseus TaxID=2219161 RepID=A0A2W1NQP0_9FLAO|nr:hypothetical protein [Putridiphycobacter roseus]PZE16978.1 hypothetical protein DNU06_09510 [Putridiphycobacter roseus]
MTRPSLIALLMLIYSFGFSQNMDSLNAEFLNLKSDYENIKMNIEKSSDLLLTSENYSNLSLGIGMFTSGVLSLLYLSDYGLDNQAFILLGGIGFTTSVGFFIGSKIKKHQAYTIMHYSF